MRLIINGEEKEFNSSTIGELLKEYNINPGRIAIELNNEIVDKNAYNKTILKENDIIEIIKFMGGG